jgi:hypothetical protein
LLPSFLQMADNDPAGATIYMPRDGRPNSASKSAVVRHLTSRACQSFERWHFSYCPGVFISRKFLFICCFLAKQLGTFWKFLFFYCKLDYFCLIFWRRFANFFILKNWEKKAYCWSAIWFLVANSVLVGKDLCIYFQQI